MVPFIEIGPTGKKKDLNKREPEFSFGHFKSEIFTRHHVV